MDAIKSAKKDIKEAQKGMRAARRIVYKMKDDAAAMRVTAGETVATANAAAQTTDGAVKMEEKANLAKAKAIAEAEAAEAAAEAAWYELYASDSDIGEGTATVEDRETTEQQHEGGDDGEATDMNDDGDSDYVPDDDQSVPSESSAEKSEDAEQPRDKRKDKAPGRGGMGSVRKVAARVPFSPKVAGAGIFRRSSATMVWTNYTTARSLCRRSASRKPCRCWCAGRLPWKG
ncbi:unnamed protein product [Ectocarpus sp. 8 AP-2014]